MNHAILVLMFLHWLADFIFQTDDMAKNKSTSFKWLTKHVLTYTGILWLGLFGYCFFTADSLLLVESSLYFSLAYAVVNGILHFLIDAVTSRVTSYLWKKQQVHWFFVAIGFDQFLHFACLYLTMSYFTLIILLLSSLLGGTC